MNAVPSISYDESVGGAVGSCGRAAADRGVFKRSCFGCALTLGAGFCFGARLALTRGGGAALTIREVIELCPGFVSSATGSLRTVPGDNRLIISDGVEGEAGTRFDDANSVVSCCLDALPTISVLAAWVLYNGTRRKKNTFLRRSSSALGWCWLAPRLACCSLESNQALRLRAVLKLVQSRKKQSVAKLHSGGHAPLRYMSNRFCAARDSFAAASSASSVCIAS